MYVSENGLGPAAFPSLKQMEDEITSGGTDSITMAIKAARDYARNELGLAELNLIAPYSAHPAFDKAAQCAIASGGAATSATWAGVPERRAIRGSTRTV